MKSLIIKSLFLVQLLLITSKFDHSRVKSTQNQYTARQQDDKVRAQFVRDGGINFEIMNNIQLDGFPQPGDHDSHLIEASIIMTGNNTLTFSNQYTPQLEPNQHLCAQSKFTDSLTKIGWDKLYVKTYQSCPPLIQSWAAGYLEGYITHHQIRDFSVNLLHMHKDQPQAIENLLKFFENNIEAMKKNITNDAITSQKNDKMAIYMGQVALIHAQSEGMLLGYNSISNRTMTMMDLWIINSDGEIGELLNIFEKSTEPNGDEQYWKKNKLRLMRNGGQKSDLVFQLKNKYKTDDMSKVWYKLLRQQHCSAIIKVIKDDNNKYKDILVSHSTWSDYSEMLRIYKYYDFQFMGNNLALPSHQVSFSSYPGCISSTDDWFIIDNQFVIFETTLELIDQDNNFDKVLPSHSYIADHYRVILANRLTIEAEDWIQWIGVVNSGTYPSTWMVVDLLKFKQSVGTNSLVPGTLYVAEQIPEIIHYADMTEHLEEKGYWGSYNVPFFKNIREQTGFERLDNEDTTEYSFERNPRGVLFEAYQKDVHDVQSLQHLMQLNTWRDDGHYDPDNKKAPSFKDQLDNIGARSDLEYDVEYLFGEIDAKVTNLEMGTKMECLAISGPSHQDHVPFKWTDFEFIGDLHRGLPNNWSFDWVTMNQVSIENKKFSYELFQNQIQEHVDDNQSNHDNKKQKHHHRMQNKQRSQEKQRLHSKKDKKEKKTDRKRIKKQKKSSN